MFKNTPKTFYMGGATPTDMTMINRGVFFMNGAEGGGSQYPAWNNMPSDWSDIRLDCPANSIALYAGHAADYSQYDNLGFMATCVGGYNVFIDGIQYGSTYASGAQCDITWSNTANTVQSLLAEGKCVQSGTPSPASPVSITCNNGVLKVDANGDIYSDGTTETFSDGTNTATAEMLLAVNSVTDTQEIISGSVTRNVGCIVLNGTENWETFGYWFRADLLDNNTFNNLICTHFEQGPATTPDRIMKTAGESYLHINYSGAETVEEFKTWLATQYSNGTPVIVLYALENPTTDTVTSQSLTGTVSLTQASLNNLRYTVNYKYSGDDIITPSILKAHKIWISPATAGNNITQFACRRVAASGTEQQGVLWAHYNLSNKIRMLGAFSSSSNYKNQQLVAFTAKNNRVFVDTSANSAFVSCSNLEYVPSFYGDGVSNYSFGATFDTCSKLKNVSLSNMKITEAYSMFNYCYDLESIENSNVIVEFGSSSTLNNMYRDCYKLNSLLPVAYNDKITNAANYITNASNLQDTIIDASGATNLTRIGTYGTSSRFMGGLKWLRVSSSAPFDNASSPQIDVSYTGMNRTALVQLFNDLPENVGYRVAGSPTINNGVVSNFGPANYIYTSKNIPYGNYSWEYFIKFTTGNNVNDLQVLCENYHDSSYYGLALFVRNSKILIRCGTSQQIFISPADVGNVLPNTTYCILASFNGIDFYDFKLGTSEEDLTTIYSTNSNYTAGNINYAVRFGARYDWQAYSNLNFFQGSIDISETYIKINNVYWFRGQPAMTKTLSCVGATGTNDLTGADKDIALNKGWSLTLS